MVLGCDLNRIGLGEIMKVTIFTDGAARGNPDGPGGYGVVLRYVDSKGAVHEKELSAGYKNHEQPHGAHGSDPRTAAAQSPV